ncbi:MAG: GAF domain-containing protein [Chloroflexi bacterium]|nr:GAF domain-containing protein [Chloroflexota bacterium]
MLHEIPPALSEPDAGPAEWSYLVEIVSAANRGHDISQVIDAELAILSTLLPFQFACALLFESAPPHVSVEQPRNVPPLLRAKLERFNPPAEFIAVMDSPQGASGFRFVFERLQEIFTASNYGAPIFVPLAVEGRALGVLVLGSDSHPEMKSEWANLAFRCQNFLEVTGNQIGVALHRARLEKRLRASEQWYSTFVNDSLDGFWETDANYNVLFVNDATAQIIGIPRAEIIGKNLEELAVPELPPHDRERFNSLMTRLKQEGSVVNEILRVMTPRGLASVSVTAHSIRDEAGRVVRLQGSLRDVTANVRARQDLEQRTHELELLHELTVRLNKTIDTRVALDAGLDIIMTLTEADAIGIWLINELEGHYDLVAHRGAEPELVKLYGSMPFDRAIYKPGFDPEVTWNLVEYLVLTRRILTAEDFVRMPRFDTSPFRLAGYQSFLVFPMMFDKEVYGVVLTGSKRPDQFDAHDIQLGESISAQLGLAIHTKRLIAKLQRSMQQAVELTRLGRMIQYAPRAEAVLPSVVREIKRVLGADYVVIRLLRGSLFETATATDMREAQSVLPILPYEAQILESENPVAVNDIQAAQVDQAQRTILTRLKLQASLAMRLYVHDHPLGILFVNQAAKREWQGEQIEFVRRAAQQIAYALENKRLLDEIKQQVRELQTLAHAGRLLGGVLHPENALQAAASEIAQVLGADCVSLHLRHDNVLQVVAESGSPDAPRLVSIARHQHRILDELDTVVINDRETEQVHPLQRALLARHGFVADLGVPLQYGNKAIGVMYISQRTPRAWTEAEIQLAETFAHQIASGLENARLLQETRVQVRDLRALARSAGLIAKSRSAQDALPQIANELRRVLNADYVGFHLLEGDFLRVVTEPHDEAANLRYPVEPYHRLALENQQRIVVRDIALDARDEAHRALMEQHHVQADIGVPMVSRNKPLGLLFVSQYTPRAWSDSEIQLVETFAQQIAGVLDVVQLLNEREARVYELAQLAELNEITTTILDQDLLADLALPALKNIFNADHTSLMFLEGEKFKSLRVAEGLVFPGAAPSLTPRLRQLFDAKECFVLDPEHPGEILQEVRGWAEYYGTRSVIAAPLVTASEAIGLMNFMYRTDHVFTRAEIQLAQTAANQLAMAFANARLLHEQKTRIEKLTHLADFSLVCGAIHESTTLQRTAARRICEILQSKAASIRLVENGRLTTGASYGYHHSHARNHPIEIDARLYQVLQQQKTYLIADLEHAPDVPEHWRARHLAEGFNALLMVPMIAEHRVTGILTLFHGETHVWHELEIQYAQTVANTLALALSNVKQKENTEHKSEELQATLDSVFSGVLATDAQGAIVSWNRKAEQITGCAAREMYDKCWDVDGPRVGEAKRADTLILEAMADKQVRFSLATRYYTRADGRVITLREVATPLRDRAGNVRGAVCAFWDRTEEQEGERAKIDFINEVAHQLGNKLSTVIMSAEQLLRADLKDKSRERFIHVIADTAHDLEAFQTRFAAFQRERVQEGIVEAELSLREIVNEKIAPLRLREPRHKFRVGGQFDLVQGDPQRLGVVIENLLDNAFKYSPPNSLIAVHATLNKSDELVLTIHNKGKPIPPEVQPHLFERWQRGDVKQRGSGLGLWLVRTKLHEMGGDICFESTARKGTTFYVTLRRHAHHLPQNARDAAADTHSKSGGQG